MENLKMNAPPPLWCHTTLPMIQIDRTGRFPAHRRGRTDTHPHTVSRAVTHTGVPPGPSRQDACPQCVCVRVCVCVCVCVCACVCARATCICSYTVAHCTHQPFPRSIPFIRIDNDLYYWFGGGGVTILHTRSLKTFSRQGSAGRRG